MKKKQAFKSWGIHKHTYNMVISQASFYFFQSKESGLKTFVSQAGVIPMIPVFVRSKTLRALDRSTTVIGAN
jgi:hypothetical protein